ncbi:MAG: hypothetical protein AAGE94_21305 [Acidobacteriota bacterium]
MTHHTTPTTRPRRRNARPIAIALLSLITIQTTAAFAGPARKARTDNRIERRADHRQDHREDRREDRQDFREDAREDRQDHRDDRREDRQDFREDRRDDRHDHRHPHWRHHRWDRWDDWVDYRRTVATARLVAGMLFATLPPEHTVVVISGTTYYVHDDVYFVKVIDSGITSYEVVDDPTVVIID